MWQDFVFMFGSSLSIFFLAPTLKDSDARVPLATSLPSMAIGLAYGLTFSTLGMTFSALGAFAAGSMWSLIAVARSPSNSVTLTRRDGVRLFFADVQRWFDARVRGGAAAGFR
jgi:NADH:ubiquinone oxidoreductase subunit H